ncbi:hypothetical protein [Thermoactinospora rubra]|uniref:hypothetical protein n=1 Tax=Thermoactinospora rubra TaxID=1088767 RepID=UPI000A11F00D|nr:hypothetical protein [Thermoactinospora rubra]
MSSVLLWLHIGFAIFTIGPLTALAHGAPRAIRTKNLPVLQFLQRMTRVYAIGSLGVFAFGLWLGLTIQPEPGQAPVLGRWYMTASMTLFIVAAALLVIVDRDLRGAVRVLSSESPEDDAKVQKGRIAALGGIVTLIWLVILFLMIVPS